MLRGFWRGASLAILVGLALSLVACSQFGKLQAKRAFKDANVQYQQQEYKKASKLYEEAVAADPEMSLAYFYLANSYDNMYKPARKGEKENDEYLAKAIENYRKASEKETDPKYRKLALEFLVSAYGADKMNDPSQAMPIVEKMIQVDPQDTDGYFRLAKIHEDAGEYDKAEAILLKAKEARPNDPMVYLQLGGFYNRQEEFGKTIEALTQRAAIEPNNPEAYYTIATYYWEKAYKDFRLKEPEKKDFVAKGMTAIDKALQIKPDYMDAIIYKGLLLRLQATFEKDAARQTALIKEAEKLQAQAKELQKKKVSGVK
ncbi:MAG: tetratricopeptide repeat protein [Acidobacteria bacterium]|nr:tetratricopeptide repeat protein [Acidobacteriota bacterium]